MIEKVGYMDNFPQLAGSVHSFFGNDTQARELSAKVHAGERWEDMLSPTDVMLTPAACYPVYPTFSGLLPRGRQAGHGDELGVPPRALRRADAPAALPRARVRPRRPARRGGRSGAMPGSSAAWRCCEGLGLPVQSDVASDPFFGRAGKMLAASQDEQKLKFEVLCPVISREKPTAICSFNWHQDHFSATFGIRTADGTVAHTACLGFGLERVTLALFKTHGFDPADWPDKRARAALAVSALPRGDCHEHARCPAGPDPGELPPARAARRRRAWLEKNCYVDLWIEFLHTLGLEPLAMLPFTVAVDFEGDQWTFFKPPHGGAARRCTASTCRSSPCGGRCSSTRRSTWRAGKLISTEADAFWLPDTAGTDYRRSHTKTTIVMTELDLERERLGYFHNAGYYELAGEDFRQLFRLDAPADPAFMPFFAEVVRIDRIVRRNASDLSDLSFDLLRRHFAWRPRTNPFSRFAARIAQDLPAMQSKGLAHYHQWAFASIRQAGAAFELLGANLRWMATQGYPELGERRAALRGHRRLPTRR